VARDLRVDYRVGVQTGRSGIAPLLARSSFPLPARRRYFAGMAQNGAKVRYTQRACRRMVEGSSRSKQARFLK